MVEGWCCNVWKNWGTGGSKKAIKMTNWTLQHLNWLVRKYTYLAQVRMASLTQWTWVWANSGRQWRTGKSGVLRSVWSQTVRHNWVTEQHQSKNTRNVRPAHCSLYLLCSQKKERKKNSFLFLFLFKSTPTPRGSPTVPGSWAQTPRASHFPCAPVTVHSSPRAFGQ